MTQFSAVTGLAAFAVLLAAACQGETGNPPIGNATPMQEPRLTITDESGQLQYSTEIWVPDACYGVRTDSETVLDGGQLVIRRWLYREDGICATVMTQLPVVGQVPSEHGSARHLVLEIYPLGGAEPVQISAPLSPEP